MIYLDYNATTPILPEVLEAMLPYLKENWGNAASTYRFGSKLKSVISGSRDKVANLLEAHPLELIFTSCGTESNNTAINAAILANPNKRHLITAPSEHSSVLAHYRALEARGYSVTYLPVSLEGMIDANALKDAITDQTALVSLMWANNETGVLSPIRKIAEICRENGTLYHCDAVQGAGKLSLDVRNVPVDYLSITGHKFGAPKGIAALFVRKTAPYSPLLFGGHQERERRGGTEPVAAIVGLGAAAIQAKNSIPVFEKKVKPLRDELERRLLDRISRAQLNGHLSERIANTSNISFGGLSSEALLLLLDHKGICASSGSACLADSDEPSHVIEAMKPGTGASSQAVRFSMGLQVNSQQIETTVNAVEASVSALRGEA